MTSAKDLELIGWAYGAADIALVQGAFRAHGVALHIHGAQCHHVLSHQAVAMVGARLLAPRSCAQEARVLLRDVLPVTDGGLRRGWVVFFLVVSVFFGAAPMPWRACFLREAGGVLTRARSC